MWQMPSGLISLLAETTDVMESEDKETIFRLWVNRQLRVVSFTEEESFEELQFSFYEEKIQYAIDRGNEGFGIQ